MLKVCPNCGKEFEPKSSRTIFCCRDCYEIFESKQKFKDVEGAIVCKECGMMGHNLLKHIGTKHSSVEEYCQKHGIILLEIPYTVEGRIDYDYIMNLYYAKGGY